MGIIAIDRIADYVFKKGTRPVEEPEMWLTYSKSAYERFSACRRNG